MLRYETIMNKSDDDSESLTILIDSARPEDAAGIISVLKQTLPNTYPDAKAGTTDKDRLTTVYSRDQSAAQAKLAMDIEANNVNSLWLVARARDSLIVGYCYALKQSIINKLQVLCVLPEYQGVGVGSRLTTQALAWLGQDKDIALEVVCDNLVFIRFYEKFGFKIAGESDNQNKKPNSRPPLTRYLMIKPAG